MSIEGSRIHHLGVLVDDLDRATAFLVDVFGLEVTSEFAVAAVPMRGKLLRWGDIEVELVERGEPADRAAALGGAAAKLDHVALQVGDLDRGIAGLRDSEVGTETAEPLAVDGVRTIFTDAPTSGGIRIQLIE